MDFDVGFAKKFKERENQEPVGPVLGTVISASPLKISIYNNQVILTEKQCYICSNLLTIKGNIALANIPEHGAVTTTCTITNILNTGDKLLCLPVADGQRFFIIDKVV